VNDLAIISSEKEALIIGGSAGAGTAISAVAGARRSEDWSRVWRRRRIDWRFGHTESEVDSND